MQIAKIKWARAGTNHEAVWARGKMHRGLLVEERTQHQLVPEHHAGRLRRDDIRVPGEGWAGAGALAAGKESEMKSAAAHFISQGRREFGL